MTIGEGSLEEVTSEGKFTWMSASPECHLFLSSFRVFLWLCHPKVTLIST